MWDNKLSLTFLNNNAQEKSLGKCAAYVRRAIEAGGIKITIPSPRTGTSASACDYGPSLQKEGFVIVYEFKGNDNSIDVTSIPGQQAGDVVVIQPVEKHPHGHMAMFNGTYWVSDFIQQKGFYPGATYRSLKPAFALYRFKGKDNNVSINEQINYLKVCFPITKASGQEFSNVEEILAHLEGEATGNWLIGSNGMWHGGIHITDATTPWCALSGNNLVEAIDFPIPYKGQQAVRCMADGEIVAYRICQDYLSVS